MNNQASFKVGERVSYFHSFYNRRFTATVQRVTRKRVFILADDPMGYLSPNSVRSFTHQQAAVCLERI